MIYVFQEGLDGPVKIGYSWTWDGYKVVDVIKSRLMTIQCGNPRNIRYLGSIPGSHSDEIRFHKYSKLAKKYHVRGEWYRPEILKKGVLNGLD